MVLLAAVVLAQGSVVYKTDSGELRLSNFSKTTVDLVAGTLTATGSSSNLITLEDTGTGVVLQAENLSVVLKRMESGNYALYSAKAENRAEVNLDSRRRKAAPSDEASELQWTVSGDRFAYERAGEDGTINLGGSIDCSYLKVTSTGRQMLDLHSTGGNLLVKVQDSPMEFLPQQGTLQGPVRFTFDQQEKWEETGRSSWHVTGVGDQASANFVAEEGIEVKLQGSVTAQITETRPRVPSGGTVPVASSHTADVSGNEALVVLDHTTRQPLRISFLGLPAETRIRTGGPR